MAAFYNQATLIYDGSSTTSNITEGQLLIGVSGTKTAASTDYVKGDGITYVVSITNSGAIAESNITVSDNIGTYTPASVANSVTPLEYIDGSVKLYINGALSDAPTVTPGAGAVSFSGIDLPAGANALLIYEARVNEYAPLSAGNAITNTVSISGGARVDTVTDSATVPVREWTALTIAKAICPAVINDNGEITYTFIIQNTGNAPAVATDNVIVTDTFNPALGNLSVALDGEELALGTGYTYDEATGAFATVGGAIPVPAATFSRNTDTGIVSVIPGVTVLTVSGTI